MPKRPRSHRLEDEARDHVKRAFRDFGWTCEDLHKDYGEDLLVRIFVEEKTTPLSFFVQSKGTDDIEKRRKDKHYFKCRVTREHLRHWSVFNEPVIFALFDPASGKTYWEQIQYFAQTEEGKKRLQRETEQTSIDIPVGNVLDEEGIRRIYSLTRRQYRKNQYQKAGSEALLGLLEDRAGIRVKEYNPEAEVIIIATEDGGAEIIFLGDLAEVIDLRCRLEDTTPKDIILGGPRENIGARLDQRSWRFLQRKNNELEDAEDILRTLRKGLQIREAFQKVYAVLSHMPDSSSGEMQSVLSEVKTQLSKAGVNVTDIGKNT